MRTRRAPDRWLDQASTTIYRRGKCHIFLALHICPPSFDGTTLLSRNGLACLVARRHFCHFDTVPAFHTLHAASGIDVAVEGQW